MKQFLISVLLALTLTHGSFAEERANRVSQYIENIKTKISHDFREFVNKKELKEHAESFVEDRQIELEPLAVKIQGQLQDIEEQLKPLTESVKENVNPLIASLQQKMESILQMLEEHANPSGRWTDRS
ncbi:type-4 ice-structuring protein LS-12-like [Poecilia reticulata]|uniref:type-4 ice-structuring protein LS-12-like n=1 Tax=Poecilia reticulata TaxID=8081 RepID=UPI0004A37EFC|nr:PREDICTED: type-4 ice-structuring protein LS-12-like [Poecilia reticulata]